MTDSTNKSDSLRYASAQPYKSTGETRTTSHIDHESRKVVSTSRLNGKLEVRVVTKSLKMSSQTNI
jgi:hypothetical protein